MATIDLAAIDDRITQLNIGFKAIHMGLQVERRGDRLTLRGTFPPKPGDARLNPYQQRLSLGIAATPQGLKQIEKTAKSIAGKLTDHTFSWKEYLAAGGGKKLSQLDVSGQIEAFKVAFFAAPDRQTNPAATKTTWQSAYQPYFRQLEATAKTQPQLTLIEGIYATIESLDVNSRSRQLSCIALNALADFLELDLPRSLPTLSGGYNPSQTKRREIPSDAEILEHWQRIPNPTWKFVYGVMATYGLRNHEVFFTDYQVLQNGGTSIQVLDETKTGRHEVWAFHPDWIEAFNLRELKLPTVGTDLTHTTLQRIGQRVTAQFRRYEIPFSPYDLRHAWAVRTMQVGLPDTIAAKMMGHSVAIHNRTYHQWISHRDHAQAVATALASYEAKKTQI
jgi:integrase